MILISKPLGQTPLESIKELQRQNQNLKDTRLAYAGRLDPMATGLLVVLEGEECKKRDAFQNLEKEYDFEVLFGVESDTFDSLGKLINIDNHKVEVKEALKAAFSFRGKFMQSYPPFSSKTVNNKPLYHWAREGKLGEIQIPQKQVEIFDIKYISDCKLTSAEVISEVKSRVELVKGDFRQEEIISSWNKLEGLSLEFQLVRFSAEVSSGTYIRALAHELGKALGTHAIAWNIKRTRVGEYRLT